MKKTCYIIGHRNPDTDSVVAATAYAKLKELLGYTDYVAARAGKLAPQTEYIFKRFKVTPPVYISDLIPKTEYYMKDRFVSVNEDVSLWKAMDTMISNNAAVLPIISSDGTYKGILNYNAFALNSFKILNPKHDENILTSIDSIAKTLNATPIVEFESQELFRCSVLIGDDDINTFKAILKEKENYQLVVVCGDRTDIIEACIDAKVKAIIVTLEYNLSKEIREKAKKNHVSILSGHDSSVPTAMLIEYSSPVSTMLEYNVKPVKAKDTVQKIKSELSKSTARCLPVVNDQNIVLGVISESDLLHEPNVEVILVDHNEITQAIEGVEHYSIQEIIDHHKINTFSTKKPINFINKTVGSTSTIITNMYREYRIPIPKEIASLLLCGILSDTLILQSATTTEIDVDTANYLSQITELDIQTLGSDIIKSGSSITGRTAEEVVHQDMKAYVEDKIKYTCSQIEVDSTNEIMERKQEFMDLLSMERKANGSLFHCLLVTDITTLSSIMLISADERFEELLDFPKRDDHIYFMKDVVSRKKQLIPLFTELLEKLK